MHTAREGNYHLFIT